MFRTRVESFTDDALLARSRYASSSAGRSTLALVALVTAMVLCGPGSVLPADASGDPPSCAPGSTPEQTNCPASNTGALEVMLVELQEWFFPGAAPNSCLIDIVIRNAGAGTAHARPWQLAVGAIALVAGTTVPLAERETALISTSIGGDGFAVAALAQELLPLVLYIDGPTRATDTRYEIPIHTRANGYCDYHVSFTDGGAGVPAVP